MIAVDTNVLVRFLTGDDPKQSAAAASVLSSSSVWIAKTVLLETEWVLRSIYKLDRGAIQEALSKLLGLSNVQPEDASSVAAALALVGQGLDFADALHVCSRPAGASFVTFDRSLVQRARRAGAESLEAVS